MFKKYHRKLKKIVKKTIQKVNYQKRDFCWIEPFIVNICDCPQNKIKLEICIETYDFKKGSRRFMYPYKSFEMLKSKKVLKNFEIVLEKEILSFINKF